MTTKKEAVTLAALHLRMTLLGQSSYSATPSKVDRGWGELFEDRLNLMGFEIVESPSRASQMGGE